MFFIQTFSFFLSVCVSFSLSPSASSTSFAGCPRAPVVSQGISPFSFSSFGPYLKNKREGGGVFPLESLFLPLSSLLDRSSCIDRGGGRSSFLPAMGGDRGVQRRRLNNGRCWRGRSGIQNSISHAPGKRGGDREGEDACNSCVRLPEGWRRYTDTSPPCSEDGMERRSVPFTTVIYPDGCSLIRPLLFATVSLGVPSWIASLPPSLPHSAAWYCA